ncbi:839_t:CDS:1 [Ambispora gerdemannii]|uniref:839_t:CDS:1 n=1 Tax=Ambispora gerdemannii TaxID=144530 RepID=A0A9N9C6Y1_9GLOM|nr:839_t:CDS:1 [Ambispora gerdemannii]
MYHIQTFPPYHPTTYFLKNKRNGDLQHKAPNAFMIFRACISVQVKILQLGDAVKISRISCELWNSLPEYQKKAYKKISSDLKAIYSANGQSENIREEENNRGDSNQNPIYDFLVDKDHEPNQNHNRCFAEEYHQNESDQNPNNHFQNVFMKECYQPNNQVKDFVPEECPNNHSENVFMKEYYQSNNPFDQFAGFFTKECYQPNNQIEGDFDNEYYGLNKD